MSIFRPMKQDASGEWQFATWNGIPGYLAELDIDSLTRLVLSCGDVKGCLVEVGSMYGLSTAVILNASVSPRKILAFDVFTFIKNPDESILEQWKQNIEPYIGDHEIVPVTGDYNETLPKLKEPIAFAFVDNGHTVNDTALCHDTIWPLLSSGGILAFHDYTNTNYPETTKYLNSLSYKTVEKRSGLISFQK